MGWVESLQGTVVGLDTSPIIYYIEEKAAYVKVVDPFFEAIRRGEISVVTSVISLLEVLVYPMETRDLELAQRYRNILLRSRGLRIVDTNQEIAEEAARLRAFHNIRTPDSIQMATAIKMNATYFLTNDLKLPSLPELKVLKLDELKTLPEYLEPDNSH